MKIAITLFAPDGAAIEYDDVAEFDSNGAEIEFTLADGRKLASNLKYLVERSA